MRNRSTLHKTIRLCNYFFAGSLLGAYTFPFVYPKHFPALAVLSLAVPVLIIINLLFVLYWFYAFKRTIFISIIVLLIGLAQVKELYVFTKTEKPPLPSTTSIKVMSYNVRLFNLYQWIPNIDAIALIKNYIEKQQPDVVCLQEFHRSKEKYFLDYPYRYFVYRGVKKTVGQAILSKFPIVNKGSLDFKNTINNAIYADILQAKDTLRVYNLHLESLRINPEKERFTQENSERIFQRIGRSFIKQQAQVEEFKNFDSFNTYPSIICVDLNNTAYSRIYRDLKADKTDTHLQIGHGFGRTFNLKYFPLRIDFIFADTIFKVRHHELQKELYSDHYAISSILER